MRLDPNALAEALRENADLSPRQTEVIRYILMGETGRQIALRLGLSARTIKMHRNAAFEALGVETTGEVWRMLFAQAGHQLDPIGKVEVPWADMFRRMGDQISVNAVMRATGRTEKVVVRHLERHGYSVK